MIEYQIGIPEGMRVDAMRLYDTAFGAKFAVAIRNPEQRRAIIAESLDLAFGIAAISDDKLVGLAGFHTPDGSLTGKNVGETSLQRLGLLERLWAMLILSFYRRGQKSAELLMDGIAVDADWRGQRIGTTLLDMIKQYARENGYATVRLDVIDTNIAARRLYERQGFVAAKTESFEFLRWLLGFGAATTMVFTVNGNG